jgi:hypothetical protein
MLTDVECGVPAIEKFFGHFFNIFNLDPIVICRASQLMT